MQEQIRKTVIYLKALHLLCWLLPLLAGIWAEAGAPWTGLLAADTRLEYAVETAIILLTIACVPLALKLFAWFNASCDSTRRSSSSLAKTKGRTLNRSQGVIHDGLNVFSIIA